MGCIALQRPAGRHSLGVGACGRRTGRVVGIALLPGSQSVSSLLRQIFLKDSVRVRTIVPDSSPSVQTCCSLIRTVMAVVDAFPSKGLPAIRVQFMPPARTIEPNCVRTPPVDTAPGVHRQQGGGEHTFDAHSPTRPQSTARALAAVSRPQAFDGYLRHGLAESDSGAAPLPRIPALIQRGCSEEVGACTAGVETL